MTKSHSSPRGDSPPRKFTRGDDWGLGDALQVFEIHPDQCGVVLHTGDQLVAAFVVATPGTTRDLVLDRAGFGHLLKPDVVDPVRARHRPPR